MRIPLFLTWVGLASAGRRSSSSRTVGNHPPTTFERTETIHFSNLVPAAVDYIELVEKRALQQRLGHGTNRQNYQPPQQQQGGGVSQGEESERGGSHGTSPPVSGSRTNHLRPVTDDDEALAVEYGGYTYHGGKGGGKGSKKGGYHNDDYYYSPEEHYDDDNDDYYYDGDDAYAYGKGSKGSKGTKSGKGGSTDKMSKKAKSSKKKLEKKLKAKGDPADDDDWMYDEYPPFEEEVGEGSDDRWSWYTESPTQAVGGSMAPSMMSEEGGSGTPTIEAGNVPARTGLGRSRATSAPTSSTTGLPIELFSSRMRPSGGNNQLVLKNQGSYVQDTTRAKPSLIGVPKVERELFPDDILLKAHSPVNLKDYDPELFAETTNFLTPCLQRAYTDQLQAYKLTVQYSVGPDASDAGVIVTHMTIHVVISVVTDTIDALKLITHATSSKVVHACFDGPQMYEYLGSLRRGGVQINEVAFLDTPFRSPIFGNVAAINSNGQNSNPVAEPEQNRVGLIVTLSVGMVVVAAAFLAHKRGKLPGVRIPTDRLGHLGSSIRNTATVGKERLGRVSKSLRAKFHHRSFGTDKAHASESNDSSDAPSVRERSWSGSFRRHPPGGVRPAALQKQPAFSKDFLKSPKSPGNYSISVGDDYNIPDEYDFQATPVSEMYGGRSRATNSRPPPERPTPSSAGDEFSMPDDYNTVNEDQSLYSRGGLTSAGGTTWQSSRGSGGPPSSGRRPGASARRQNPFVGGASSPTPSVPSSTASDSMGFLPTPMRQESSPNNNADGCMDEWSMNSFTTSSPHGTSSSASDAAVSPPYRHWDQNKPRGSPGSKLAMPRLS